MISIIVPVYNVEQYLVECLESIQAQTYKNFEVLLIDDGSLDASGEMCDKFRERDSRFKVFHRKNVGLGLTRNFGMREIQGEWVCFVDSDDRLSPEFLLELKGYTGDNIDAVVGGYGRFEEGPVFEEKRITKKKCVIDGPTAAMKILGSSPGSSDSIKPMVWGNLYRAQTIKKNKIKFLSERKFVSEDLLFNFRYFQNCQELQLAPTVGYQYRLNRKSITQGYRERLLEKHLDMFFKMRQEATAVSSSEVLEEAIIRSKKTFFIALRNAVKQEKQTYKKNPNLAKRNIREIVRHQEVQELIASYPVRKLPFKQQVFIRLVKYKQSLLLELLVRGGLV